LAEISKIPSRIYGDRDCSYCGVTFVATTPNKKYCSPICLSKVYKQHYSGDWSRQNAAEYRRRASINKIWGITNPSYWKKLWKLAEQQAVAILKAEGFDKIYPLSESFTYSPFDLKAEIDHFICGIQVTTATQQPTFFKRLRLANALGIEYYILFVKPNLRGYVLKNGKIPGGYKLFLNDVNWKVKPVPGFDSECH